MKLSQVEHERSGLIQFLVVLIMIFLFIIVVLSYRQQQGIGIPVLAILSLCACLYAVLKERRLRRLQEGLVQELIASRTQVEKLGEDLEAEHAELEEARHRSEKLDMRLHEIASLYRAIAAVNAAEDLVAIPETVLTAGLQLVEGNCGSVMLLDEPRKHLVIACSRGLSAGIPERTRQKVGDGVAGWVVEHGQPLLLTGGVEDDERFKNLQEKRDVLIAMSVPLALHGRVLGVLNIGSNQEALRDEFAEGHLRVATIFGQHASVAIRNAQLTTTLREHGLLGESAT